MRHTINNKEIVVRFGYTRKGCPINKNGSLNESGQLVLPTRLVCYILSGEIGSRDTEKNKIADVTVRKDSRDSSNLVYARRLAFAKALVGVNPGNLTINEKQTLWETDMVRPYADSTIKTYEEFLDAHSKKALGW